jgi:arylsulfatase A-like enzyme
MRYLTQMAPMRPASSRTRCLFGKPFLSFTDAQLGKVFSAMDRLKLWDSTIVFLIGDYGYHLGEHEWWNKVTIYEHCAGAPMMLWVPDANRRLPAPLKS